MAYKLPAYLTKSDVRDLLDACIRFYATALLGEGYAGYLVTSWAVPHLGYKWKNSHAFFADMARLTGGENIKEIYDTLASWEGLAPASLTAPEAQELSATVPRNLKELEEALERAKSEQEKNALVKNYVFYKTKAQPQEAETAPTPRPVEAPATAVAAEIPIEAPKAGEFSIKITPAALKVFEESAGKVGEVPLQLVSFFAPAKGLTETPQSSAAIASAMSLSQISAKAEGLPDIKKKHFLRLVENLRQAEFSFYGQVRLAREFISVRELTILAGTEVGLPRGQVALVLSAGRGPGERGPSFLGRVGQQLFGGLAKTAVRNAATKVVSSALTKAGISVTTKAAGAAVTKFLTSVFGAAIGGPVGAFVGAIIGWLGSKVLGPLIDKLLDLIQKHPWVLALPLVIPGLIFGIPILTAAGLGLGALLAARSVGTALTGAAGGVSTVLLNLGSYFVVSIGLPLAITLVSLPVIIVLILFIINSGAYLVPPKASLLPGAIESPYIGVEKAANPTCMNRQGCPGFGNVKYSVRIFAKKGTLTNVKVSNVYTIIAKTGKTITPPTPDALKKSPLTVSPTQDLIFDYTIPIDQSFNDSVIVDTITVTADVAEKNGEIAAASASVVVGNPKISCPVPGGRMGDGSYTPGDETRGHGSNDYWRRMGTPCHYSLPQKTGCVGPDNSGNVCSGRSSCPYYGYAEDVFPTGTNDVLAPTVLGVATTWTYNGTHFSNSPSGYSYGYTDASGKYSILFTHIKDNATTGSIPSGGKIGELFPQGGNTHLHIEFQVNGQYQKPENFFCR